MKSTPPWDKETELFEHPDARCELFLDGQFHYASIAVWEGYCYFKVDSLRGLWAITRPYDNTDLTQFVTSHIDAGEVGKVYQFFQAVSNLNPVTKRYAANHQYEPLTTLDLVAIIRFDNSALVRETRAPLFVETPAFANGDRRAKRNLPPTKAHRPSLWHPKRLPVGRQQIARQARELAFQAIPEEELSRGKTGSISELSILLEALWLCGSVRRDFSFYQRGTSLGFDYHHFHWPYERKHLFFSSRDLHSRIDLMPFLEILWEHYHFEKGSWIPAKHTAAASITNKRYEWEKADALPVLMLAMRTTPSAHERLEASLVLEHFFKGKISDEKLKDLLGEPPTALYLT